MFKIEINTASAAFDAFPEGELIRILQRVKEDLFKGNGSDDTRNIHDINGNTIGIWTLNKGGRIS